MSAFYDAALSSICFLQIYLLTAATASQLVFVQSLFRHGDRNPGLSFPTDVANNESTWENGFGELTDIGVADQYELGRFIKRRYSDFLSERYNAKEIYVRSTGFNRTIMSALANLAGMYPPFDDQVWNKNIPWMPIPVHNKPKYEDPVLWMDYPCKAVEHLYRTKVMTSDAYQKVEKANAAFIEFVRQKAGLSSLTLLQFWDIYDPLYCQAMHNDTHKWPSWVNDTVWKKILELYHAAYYFSYHLPEIQRFRGALLFQEIASRNIEKIADSLSYIRQLKYYAYSLHDKTQAALLENLKASDGSLATYSQVLLFELHENNGSYFVELFKRNDSKSDIVVPIRIPECGEPCLANRFLELSQRNVPTDYDVECGNTSPVLDSTTSTATTSGADTSILTVTDTTVIRILAVLALICFLLFLWTLVQFCKLKKSRYVVDKVIQ